MEVVPALDVSSYYDDYYSTACVALATTIGLSYSDFADAIKEGQSRSCFPFWQLLLHAHTCYRRSSFIE